MAYSISITKQNELLTIILYNILSEKRKNLNSVHFWNEILKNKKLIGWQHIQKVPWPLYTLKKIFIHSMSLSILPITFKSCSALIGVFLLQ